MTRLLLSSTTAVAEPNFAELAMADEYDKLARAGGQTKESEGLSSTRRERAELTRTQAIHNAGIRPLRVQRNFGKLPNSSIFSRIGRMHVGAPCQNGFPLVLLCDPWRPPLHQQRR